jgi:gas vesicle protein
MGDNDTSSKLGYFLVGAGVGAVVALLFAPKPGRELRGNIADVTRRGIDYANDGARNISERATNVYQTGREKAGSLYGRSREKTADILEASKTAVSEQKERVAAAIEAGKRAYQEKKLEAAQLTETELPEES